jgi:type IX secretion system PorP/SprF family membrane protein
MKHILRIIPCILALWCPTSWAQNYPVYNSYYANPYLYNPAAIATDYSYLFVHHRQQWTGVEGSPVLSAISYNSMIDQTRAGVGFKLSSYQRGLLNTTDLSLSYSYALPVSKTSMLYFGLSGGAISNSVDITKATSPSDPALLNGAANNFQPTANVGLLFQSASGINLGLVLPQLFSTTYLSTNFSEFSVSPTDNFIASIGYRKKTAGKIVTKKIKGVKRKMKSEEGIAPLELYLLYKHAALGNSQFEALAKLSLSENFWVGGSYRQNYGVIMHTGIQVKKLLIGYSFELGSQPEAGFSSGTHELFAGLKLGERKKFKKNAPTFRSTLTTTNQPQHRARFQHAADDDPEAVVHESGTKASKKQYYVVIRAFADFAGADVYKKKLINDKYNADIYYHEKDRKYYVHVLKTKKSSEAYEEARNLKNYTKLKDARVIVIDEN